MSRSQYWSTETGCCRVLKMPSPTAISPGPKALLWRLWVRRVLTVEVRGESFSGTPPIAVKQLVSSCLRYLYVHIKINRRVQASDSSLWLNRCLIFSPLQTSNDGGAKLSGCLWRETWTFVLHLWPDGLRAAQVWVSWEADGVVCGSRWTRVQCSWPLSLPTDVHSGMSTGRLQLVPNTRCWHPDQTAKGIYLLLYPFICDLTIRSNYSFFFF